MTIPYDGSMLKALFRWYGSVWKAVWKELLCWLVIYYVIRGIVIHVVLKDSVDEKEPRHTNMRDVVSQFFEYTKNVPIEFLLGFYVTQTISRWWSQVLLVSSPHEVMGTIAAYIHGIDEESQNMRYVIARYLVLYAALAYRNFSSKIRKLFPTNEHFLQIGLLTEEEKDILDRVPKGIAHELIYQWIIEMVREKDENHRVILNCLNVQRANIKQLAKYNDFPLPLVYTQTVTIAVYGYFTFALIGHQFYHVQPFRQDIWFPFFTVLRFFFSVGWLKVAEYLSKPFGNDDDDIDLCASLSGYCDRVFAIATFSSQKPTKCWEDDDTDLKYDHIQTAFKEHIEKYERMGTIISKNFNKLLRSRPQVEPKL